MKFPKYPERVVSATERRFLDALESFLRSELPPELIVAQLFHAAIVISFHCGLNKVGIIKHVSLHADEVRAKDTLETLSSRVVN
jgi:hypothetical protein